MFFLHRQFFGCCLRRDQAALRQLERKHEKVARELVEAVGRAGCHREAGLLAVAAAEDLRDRALAAEQLSASLQSQLDEARSRGRDVLLQAESAATQVFPCSAKYFKILLLIDPS